MREKNLRLVFAMLQAKMSQRDLAKQSGVSYVQINHLINGRNHPTRPTARAIAKALNSKPEVIGLGEVWPK